MMQTKDQIYTSLKKVEKWVEDHEYRGYEPFDGLSSFLRPLTFNNNFAERILQQIVRQAPVNLRPLLGIRPKESTKGRGYMVAGYLTMLKLTGEQEYKEKAINCLEWLIKHKSPKYKNYCWGNHYDFFGSRRFVCKIRANHRLDSFDWPGLFRCLRNFK